MASARSLADPEKKVEIALSQAAVDEEEGGE